MKYVRVYESDCYPEEYITTYLNHCEHVVNLQNAGFDFEGCIVDQADTIEELCDEFRGIWINYYESEKKDAHEEYHYDKERDIFYDDFEELTREEAIEKFDIFYGAIWTDIGLIYVTRLDGEKAVERGFKLL